VKPPEDSAASRTPFSLSRSFLIPCFISFLLPIAACVGLHPLSWALILLRAPDFLLVVLWLAAATGLGAAILKLTGLHRRVDGLLKLISATATGLGLMSLLVLAVGLCTRLDWPIAWGILLVGWLAGAWAWEVWFIQPDCNVGAGAYRWLGLLCAAALGLASLAALVPPGILWGDEPNGYDVLEYHLQVPREWYQLGRIVPLQHNVFSYFPFNVEMHYLLAMALRGGPWSGMYLAQLMHVAFVALTVLAVYALVAERSRNMAVIAAAAVATVPWMGLLAPVAYDEGGLLLWGTLAIGLSLRGGIDWRTMSLAGAMAGFACGSKLTAVPIVLLATPAIALAVARFKSKAVLAAVSYFLSGCIVFSPWLLKNVAWIGNPVFPEATALFGRGDWSQTQVDRWIRANHLPRPDQQNLSGRTAAAWNQVIVDWRYGFVLLPLAIVSAAISWRERETRALMLILIALAIFWLFFTHLQSRFFTLAIPISALLIGQVRRRREVSVAYSFIVLLAGLSGLAAVYQKLTSINPHLFEFVGTERLSGLTPLADRQIPPQARIYLIGDGRAFLYDVPMDRLFYRTVFDVDAKPEETSDQAWSAGWPAVDSNTIQVIDAPELRRFARTYWAIPLPSTDVMQMQTETVR
jgi:hypothetical protein